MNKSEVILDMERKLKVMVGELRVKLYELQDRLNYDVENYLGVLNYGVDFSACENGYDAWNEIRKKYGDKEIDALRSAGCSPEGIDEIIQVWNRKIQRFKNVIEDLQLKWLDEIERVKKSL